MFDLDFVRRVLNTYPAKLTWSRIKHTEHADDAFQDAALAIAEHWNDHDVNRGALVPFFACQVANALRKYHYSEKPGTIVADPVDKGKPETPNPFETLISPADRPLLEAFFYTGNSSKKGIATRREAAEQLGFRSRQSFEYTCRKRIQKYRSIYA